MDRDITSEQALIQLALNQGLKQKDLASKLGVSATQVSKWKKGEHMSFDMKTKLEEIIDLNGLDAAFVLWCGSLEEAKKWEKLIRHLAEIQRESAETGYDTSLLGEENELLCWRTFRVLKHMGVVIPPKFPEDLSKIWDEADDDDFEREGEIIEDNPYSRTIMRMFRALNDLEGFYTAYISGLDSDIDDKDTDDACDLDSEIYYSLIDLSACKIDMDKTFAPDSIKFKRETLKDYRKWLVDLKEMAFRAGVPLRAELLDLVYQDHDPLGHEAEAESMGCNDDRLHPDIYMNELLVGMRLIHQVLPVIMEKLGIDDFEVDDQSLRISGKD